MSKRCKFQAVVIIDGQSVRRVVIADDITLETRLATVKRTGRAVRLSGPDFGAFKVWQREAPADAYEKKDGPIFRRKRKRRKKKRNLKPSVWSGGLPSLGQRR